MFSRVRLYQITLLLGLVACGGDDSGSSESTVGVAGASAGRSGSSGSQAGTGGRASRGGAAGRGSLAGRCVP